MKARFWLCHIAVPLSLGLLLYLVLRPDAYISQWLTRGAAFLPGAALPAPLLEFLRCHAGDMLWAYALTAALVYVLRGSKNALPVSALLAIALGGALELCQKRGLLSGTADALDVLFEALTCIFAVLLIKNTKEDKR